MDMLALLRDGMTYQHKYILKYYILNDNSTGKSHVRHLSDGTTLNNRSILTHSYSQIFSPCITWCYMLSNSPLWSTGSHPRVHSIASTSRPFMWQAL